VAAEAEQIERTRRKTWSLRVQLVEELAASGVPPASIAAAMRSGALSLSCLDRFPGPSPRSDRTFEEICVELAIPFELLDRVLKGAFIPIGGVTSGFPSRLV
jgi:hypothetical protein